MGLLGQLLLLIFFCGGCGRSETIEFRFTANEPATLYLNGTPFGDVPQTLSIEELAKHFQAEWEEATSSQEKMEAVVTAYRASYPPPTGRWTMGGGGNANDLSESSMQECTMRQPDGSIVYLLRLDGAHIVGTGYAYAGGYRASVVAKDGTTLELANVFANGHGGSRLEIRTFERK